MRTESQGRAGVIAGIAVAVILLLGASAMCLTHFRLVFELGTGLTLAVLRFARGTMNVTDMAHLASGKDLGLLFVPIAVYFAARQAHRHVARVFNAGCAGMGVIALGLWMLPGPALPAALASNPAQFVARDLLRAPLQFYLGAPGTLLENADLPGDVQMRSVALIDDAFIETNAVPGEPDWTPGPAAQEPWNILFFVLESTGADYVFDTSLGNDVPMPFLHHAATNGVWLANHYSTCNSSPRAGFSIFTGLYPRADHDQTFEVEHHVSIPALNRYLGTPFQCFVVHPASLTYCFPLGVLYNSGFHLLRDRKNIPPGARPDPTPLARNELESVDVLLHHLDTAREPFFGIYWTYVPHHPYSDYGPEYRVLPDLADRRHRYYNNLRLLDSQLQRVHDHLARAGKLDRTLFVFVGDHGQAFGQHAGVWGHNFGPYGETYRAPVIFYQPRLFPARRIDRLTSHVDVLPTMLDLMGRPWDRGRIQGESALRRSVRRQIFFMDGPTLHLGAIDRDLNKVSIAFGPNQVLAFNLRTDAAERSPLSGEAFQRQVSAILKFRNYQWPMMETYNAALISRRDLDGSIWSEQRLRGESSAPEEAQR